MVVYAIIAGVILLTLLLAFWIWRTEYRRFQKMYRVKLPFLCVVTLTKEKDNISHGTTRHRFITKDGKRDKRCGFNFKIYYPTTIVINHFKVRIWDKLRANEIYLTLEPRMQLPLSKCVYRGEIKGDPIRFFRGSRVMFERYCGKLLDFYGWKCELCYSNSPATLTGNDGNNLWLIKCIFTKSSVVLNDIIRLENIDVDIPWLVITNSTFSNGAKERAWKHGWMLMDLSCLKRTIMHEQVMFL